MTQEHSEVDHPQSTNEQVRKEDHADNAGVTAGDDGSDNHDSSDDDRDGPNPPKFKAISWHPTLLYQGHVSSNILNGMRSVINRLEIMPSTRFIRLEPGGILNQLITVIDFQGGKIVNHYEKIE